MMRRKSQRKIEKMNCEVGEEEERRKEGQKEEKGAENEEKEGFEEGKNGRHLISQILLFVVLKSCI